VLGGIFVFAKLSKEKVQVG